MQIMQPNSTAVRELAFDPNAATGDVLVRFASGNTTYRYGPWPLADLKRAVTGQGSVGREIANLRRGAGSCDSFEGDCAAAMVFWSLAPGRRVSPLLKGGADALLAF